MKSRLLGAVFSVSLILFSASTKAVLIDNGDGLIYDTALNITWSQLEPLIWENLPEPLRSWDDAHTWASGLTLGGVSGWRLPYISVAQGAGPFTGLPVDCNTATELDCRDNEMGYMFYRNLGGTFGQPITDSGDPDLALFPNLLPIYTSGPYWSGTEFDSLRGWLFNFDVGASSVALKNNAFTWAVHAGDVSAVPIPAAMWLFGSGLLGLVGIARRKKAA